MLRIARSGAAALLAVVALASGADAQWYSGGNLSGRTLADWRQATAENRLATSADIVVVAMGQARVIRETGGDFDKLRPFAEAMRTCIDEVAVEESAGTQPVADIAALCAVLLGYR
jgi:hypothetical protein